jgi:hypothetical protein
MFCEETEWIYRYAYFGDFRQGEGGSYIGQNGAVWDANGDITDVGRLWLGLDTTPGVQGSESGAGTDFGHIGFAFWISIVFVAFLLM